MSRTAHARRHRHRWVIESETKRAVVMRRWVRTTVYRCEHGCFARKTERRVIS